MELELSGLSLEDSKMVVHFYFMDDYRAPKWEKAKNKCKKECYLFDKRISLELSMKKFFLRNQRLFYMCVKMNNQNKKNLVIFLACQCRCCAYAHIIAFTVNNYLIYKPKQNNLMEKTPVNYFYLVAADSWFKTTVLN